MVVCLDAENVKENERENKRSLGLYLSFERARGQLHFVECRVEHVFGGNF